MSKGEFMMSELVKVFLGIVVLIILFILAYQLSMIYLNDTKSKQAEVSLESVYGFIEEIEEGDEKEIIIESPSGWMLEVWPNKNTYQKPQQCRSSYCLCMCPSVGLFGFSLAWERELRECNKYGVCKGLNFKGVTIDDEGNENFLGIDGVEEFDIFKKNNEVIIREK